MVKIQDYSVRKPIFNLKKKDFRLDEVNESVILIREEGGVCFVRENWEKWKNILEVLSRASVIHCDQFYTQFP